MSDNLVIRTSPRWDAMVRHLGYISVDTPTETDRQLVERSQMVLSQIKVIPINQLTQQAFTHLKLARLLAGDFDPNISVHAAIIPPASDRVKTAGLYDMSTKKIMLHPETLEKARTTVDAMVHELGHHVASLRVDDSMKAEDLQPAHSEAMTYVAARVFSLAAEKKFDEYLKDAVW